MKLTNRRKFVKHLSFTSLSLLSLPLFLGSCEDFFEKIRNRPVRRCINGSVPVNEQLEIYNDAVAAMKALPTSDPRNWVNQASIHQNFCPHGNWFFFPWHRVYLYYFEEICRKLSGEPSFGLPYWNWCVTPSIPSQFWGASNPLFNATRVATSTSTTNPSSVGLPLVNGFCNEPNFNVFAGGSATSLRPPGPRQYGNIEGTPHNYIHGFVGGDMSSFMSPLDPIFWSHHCMVDVCYYEWNILRNHANINDPAWMNFDYSGMFVDGNGNNASMTTVGSLLLPFLSYRYETGINCEVDSGTDIMANIDKEAFNKVKTVIQKGAPIKMDIKHRFNIAQTTVISTKKGGVSTLKTSSNNFSNAITNTQNERVVLKLNGVSEPTDTDLFLRVFINKDDANAKTSTSDPTYAGSFFFFRHSKDSKSEMVNFTVDITNTLRKLKKSGSLNSDDNLYLNMVSIPLNVNDKTEETIMVKSIEINIADITTEKMKF